MKKIRISITLQHFIRRLRLTLNHLGIRRNRTIVFAAPTDFHFQHILPVIRQLEGKPRLSITIITVPDWHRCPDIKNAVFMSEAQFQQKKWRFIDVLLVTEFASVPWWFCSGLRIGLFHGAGPKKGYLEILGQGGIDVVFSPGPTFLRLQRNIVKDSPAQKTRVIPIGLPALDDLYLTTQRRKKPANDKPLILYAPSWHVDPSLIAMDEIFLQQLSTLEDYHIMIRPHPNLLVPEKCAGTDWRQILKRYEHDGFEVSIEGSTYDQLHRADAMIGDYSSVLFEYLIFDRPGFIYASEDLLNTVLFPSTVPPLMAAYTHIQTPDRLSEVIAAGMVATARSREARNELTDDSFYNLGTAAAVAAKEIMNLTR